MSQKIVTPDENAQARFLSVMCRDKTLVWLYLIDGTRLESYISSFDADTLHLDDGQAIQKSAICAVIPVHPKE